MFINNSSNNDDSFEDFRRYEEYQRQKDANFARGVGNFLYRYIVYSMIWIFSSVLFSILLKFLLGWNEGITTIIGMVAGLFLFKISYIKTYPFKSLLTVWFIIGLVFLAFGS